MTDLQAWVGRTQVKTELLCPRRAGLMAATLNRVELLDVEEGRELPPGWHWMFFNQIASHDKLGPDGHPQRGDFLPPVKLERRMWAGSRLHWLRPLIIGTMVRREATILKVAEKIGRNGTMVFVTVGYTYKSDNGLLLEEEHDIVYRGTPGEYERKLLASVPAQAAAFAGDFERRGEVVERIDADSALLFRYSAVTFNGHRIHYDLPYAIEEEGYPGLVVHGPLIATMLLGLIERSAGSVGSIERFEFRAKSPTFLISPFHLHLSKGGVPGQLAAWSTNNVGAVALDCSATLREGIAQTAISDLHATSPFLPICPQ